MERCDGFAEVLPEHKFQVVQELQKAGHIVGMTGDGVNDAPALKLSNVGIAVSGATDAARASASIFLQKEGLSVIVSAIMRSKKVFLRSRWTIASNSLQRQNLIVNLKLTLREERESQIHIPSWNWHFVSHLCS